MQKIYLLRIMKHTHKYLIFAISIFLVSLLTLGCQEKEEKKVVLIHSFEQKKDTYPIFNEVLERTFNKQKINPKIHTFYLAYIIHSGFISGYQNRYGDNLKPPTNVYHRMTA